MARMGAIGAAVRVPEAEGVTTAFVGVPGAAVDPLHAALKGRGPIRHVPGASPPMADGHTRARAGNVGLCIGTTGPTRTDVIDFRAILVLPL
jgi:tartronate-semialdehyde synthase